MNWQRKEALREEEKRKVKTVVPRVVAVNMPNPKKEFVRLPLIFTWTVSCVPVIIVASPNIMFDELCDSYYEAIRRAYSMEWHSDSDSTLTHLQGVGYEPLVNRRIHIIAFNPDRHSMSMLMRDEDKMHAKAKAHYENVLERGSNRSITPPISRTYMSEYTVTIDGRTVGTGTMSSTNLFYSTGTWSTIS